MKLSLSPLATRAKPACPRGLLMLAIAPLLLIGCSNGTQTDAGAADTTVNATAAATKQASDTPTELAAVAPESTVIDPSETLSAKPVDTTKTASITTLSKPPATAARSNPDVDANAIPKLKNEVGALADVTVKSCAKASGADGDWKSAGTVTNSSKAAAAYVITTAFLDAKGTTVGLGFSQVDRLKAGASRDWSVTAQTTVGEGLQCIMRVTRGDV